MKSGNGLCLTMRALAQFLAITPACKSLTKGHLFNSKVLSKKMRGENVHKINPRAVSRK